jgi:hypothetical protein
LEAIIWLSVATALLGVGAWSLVFGATTALIRDLIGQATIALLVALFVI